MVESVCPGSRLEVRIVPGCCPDAHRALPIAWSQTILDGAGLFKLIKTARHLMAAGVQTFEPGRNSAQAASSSDLPSCALFKPSVSPVSFRSSVRRRRAPSRRPIRPARLCGNSSADARSAGTPEATRQGAENYTYSSLQTVQDLDSNGQVKKTESPRMRTSREQPRHRAPVKKRRQAAGRARRAEETEHLTKLVEKQRRPRLVSRSKGRRSASARA